MDEQYPFEWFVPQDGHEDDFAFLDDDGQERPGFDHWYSHAQFRDRLDHIVAANPGEVEFDHLLHRNGRLGKLFDHRSDSSAQQVSQIVSDFLETLNPVML